MKRCPSCQQSYTDDTLRFCLDDGSPLIEDTTQPFDSGATLVAPSAPEIPGTYRAAPDARTHPIPWRAPTDAAQPPQTLPAYPSAAPPAQQGRSYAAWIVGGVLLVFVLCAVIAGALLALTVIRSGAGSSSSTSSSGAKQITVSKLGGGDYTSINAALRSAPAGARINVRPGIYNETVMITSNVEIVGDGPASQIVIEAVDDNCVIMKTGKALVRGLTLRNRSTDKNKSYYAVSIEQGELALEDCDITSNSLAGVGVYGPSTRPAIRRCRIHDCVQSGLYFYQNARGLVEDCDIFNNGLAGISVEGAADPTIRNSRLYNGKASGVYVYKTGRGTIEDCYIHDNAYWGVSISEGGDPLVNRCKINRNGYSAVASYKGGKGSVQNSDLTGNKEGAWDIDTSSAVRRSANTE